MIVAFFATATMAAGQQEHYILNTAHSGTQEYIARDYISLQPGFSYSATQGNNFKATINPKLLFEPAGNLTGDPGGSVGEIVDNNGVVGAIPGQFSASPTGAAMYTIPVECPAGINGMTPSVSLVYNSQAGNGIAGWGWNIAGLSSITRTQKTVYDDNEAREIRWDETDVFALDGARLYIKTKYPSGATQANADSIEYTKESDYTTKIMAYNFSESGPESFKVWTGDGKIYTYGSTMDISIKQVATNYYVCTPYPSSINFYSNPGGTITTKNTLAWGISAIKDPYNNQINFSYESDESGSNEYASDTIFYDINDSQFQNPINRFYLVPGNYYFCEVTVTTESTRSPQRIQEITYAGGDYKIGFIYENRPDIIDGYISGERLYSSKRLHSIKLDYTGGSVATQREYSLIYQNDIYSKLQKVQLAGKNNEKFNYTVFNWTSDNFWYVRSAYNYTFQDPANKANRINNNWIPLWSSNYPADFNGDGLTDFLRKFTYAHNSLPLRYAYDWAVYISNGSASSNPLAVNAEGEFQSQKFYLFDSNMDGKTELFFPTELNAAFPYVKYIGYDYNTAFQRNESLDFSIRLNSGIPWNQVELLHNDFDGDGKLEYLLLNVNGDDGHLVSHNNSKDFLTNTAINNFGESESYFFADINGNSKQEIAFLRNDRIDFWESTNNSSAFTLINSLYYKSSGYKYIGDFNGDGNDDLLIYDNTLSSWSIKTSNGDYFTNIILPPPLHTSGIASEKDFLVNDFNHDGKSDILATKNSNEIQLFISNGHGFDLVVDQTGITSLYTNQSFSGNADGNLAPDCFFGSNPYSYAFVSQFGSNIITGISVGSGDSYSLLYKTNLNRFGRSALVQSSADGSKLVVTTQDFQSTIRTVARFDDGIFENYEFKNPVIHLNGKGFLGYETILTNRAYSDPANPSNSFITYSRVHNKLVMKHSLRYELLPDSITTKVGNTSISKTINYYSSHIINDAYNILADSTVTYDLVNDTRQVKKIISYTSRLLPENVITQSWAHYSKEAETVESMVYNENISNGKWFIGLLSQKTITQKRSGVKDYSRVYNYEYYPSTGALKDEYTQKNSAKEVKKSYTYDGLGNINNVTTVAAGDVNDPRTRTTSMTYTPDGRFPATQTDVLSHSKSYVFSDETGLLQSETDINGFTTSYFYDGFGRLKKTIYHDKMEEMSSLFWTGDNPSAPSGSTFYSVKQASGSAPVTTYYDKFGKELRTSTIGLSGNVVIQDKQYDFAQRPWKESLPYFSGTTPLWNKTTYDAYNRIDSLKNADGSFAKYNYDVREVTVTSGKAGHTQTTSKKTNSLGETIESTDNGSSKVITRYFASGLPKEMQIDGSPFKTEFIYDVYGNRDTINDPDAGKIVNVYTALGNLKSTKDNKNQVTTYEYDLAGRITSEQINGVSTVYAYDQSLLGVTNSVNYNNGSNTVSYNYDSGTGQLLSQTETIQQNGVSKALTTSYTYDAFGRMKNQAWSTGYQVSNTYNDKGYLTKISDAGHTLWEASAENALGKITAFNQGSYSTSVAYNEFGDLQGMLTAGVRSMSYGFDDLKNLNFRSDNLTNQKEVFIYDNLNRLSITEYYHNQIHQPLENDTIFYDNLGNITGKTDLAWDGHINYGEENYGPHALTSIDKARYYPMGQFITYTPFNKVSAITDTLPDNSLRNLVLTYGIDEQRKKTVYTHNSTTITKYFFGDYEEVNNGSTTNKYFFVSSPTGICAIYFVEGANPGKLYYTFTDHLGSLTELVDASTGAVTRQSFDAWGNKRDVSDWTIPTTYNLFADRGFTGHEHLEEFELINMNGRVYDPALGRFLSPDPYVQMPDFSQSFNRYSYCFNNPLVYTDPDGEWALIDDLIAMGLGGLYNLGSNLLTGNVHSLGEAVGYFVSGVAAGEATLYGGPLAGGAVLGLGNNLTSQVTQNGWNNINWKQAAISTGMGVATSYLGGQISNAVSPYVSNLLSDVSNPIVYNTLNQGLTNAAAGFTLSTGMSLVTGNDLRTSLGEGLRGAAFGTGLGLITGSIQGYKMQQEMKRNASLAPIEIKPSPLSEGTLTKGQLRSNVSGDYELALREWNNIQQQYGISPTQGVPNGFTTTFPDGTIVRGQFYYGGTTNPTGYNIKVIMIPQGLKINKMPPIHIRYNNDW